MLYSTIAVVRHIRNSHSPPLTQFSLSRRALGVRICGSHWPESELFSRVLPAVL